MKLLELLEEDIKMPVRVIMKLLSSVKAGANNIKKAAIGVLGNYFSLRSQHSIRKTQFVLELHALTKDMPHDKNIQVKTLSTNEEKAYILGTLFSRNLNWN